MKLRALAESPQGGQGSEASLSAESPVCTLSPDVARKIAAGEVIDRPCAIVRELIDNAIDANPSSINVEIAGGGIESVRVQDDGCGMTKSDLASCARPHATSKLHNDSDLLNLTTMGFRGEALSSIAAVCRLTIKSGGYTMRASVTDGHTIIPSTPIQGTAVTAEGLFENFPARRHFLKRPAAEGAMCRATFIEKSMSRPDIKFTFTNSGERTLTFPSCNSATPLKDRFVSAAVTDGTGALFHEVKGDSGDGDWSFTAVLGDCAVWRPTRREIYIYVNGRRIQEYSLVQAIEYGALGFFPNGTYPVASLFVNMKPSLVDFNIHPAKKEARFQDIAPLHRGVSTAVRAFYTKGIDRIQESKHIKETEYDITGASVDGTHASSSYSSPYSSPYSTPYSPLYTLHSPPSAGIISRPAPSSSSVPPLSAGSLFLGTALGVFLVAEKDGVLYLIDQHAAHERLLYDAMMKGGDRQPLLVPYILQTSSEADGEYMKQIAPNLTKAGFDTRQSDGGKWEVWSAPSLWRGGEKELFDAVLGEQVDPSEVIRRVAAKSACRDAVKDGTYMDNDSARDLAMAALALKDPHCPHGRPIWCAFTKEELFRMVRRID